MLDGHELVIKQSIAIYSTKDRNFYFLDSPFGLSMEKNWVPIEVVDDKLMVFYSSQPGRVLEINLNTAKVKVNSIKSDPAGLNFHGRSQFVKLPNKNFLRVASLRLPIKDFGLVHFSFLLEHGANYEVVRISRPFLFNTPGFEICNGLGLYSPNELIFTWGCNDRSSYFAKVPLEQLMNWFLNNELTIKNFQSKNWANFRKIFRNLAQDHICECKGNADL